MVSNSTPSHILIILVAVEEEEEEAKRVPKG
jgi:hypothetical protein